VLSLAASILVTMTSFNPIVVVLSPLRTALGTATSPPDSVVNSLPFFAHRLRHGAGAHGRLVRATAAR
jgi:flagellar biosynthesis protein FliP